MEESTEKDRSIQRYIEFMNKVVNKSYRHNYHLMRANLQENALLGSDEYPQKGISKYRLSSKKEDIARSRADTLTNYSKKLLHFREDEDKYLKYRAFSMSTTLLQAYGFNFNMPDELTLTGDIDKFKDKWLIDSEFGLRGDNLRGVDIENLSTSERREYGAVSAVAKYLDYVKESLKLRGLYQVYYALGGDFDFQDATASKKKGLPHDEVKVINIKDIDAMLSLASKIYDHESVTNFDTSFRINELKSGINNDNYRKDKDVRMKLLNEFRADFAKSKVRLNAAGELCQYLFMLKQRYDAANKSILNRVQRFAENGADFASFVKKSVRKIRPFQEDVYIGNFEVKVLKQLSKYFPEVYEIAKTIGVNGSNQSKGKSNVAASQKGE